MRGDNTQAATHTVTFPLNHALHPTAELGGKHRRHKKHRRKHRKHRKHHSHAGEGDNDKARISDLSGAKQDGSAATAGDDEEEDNKLADEALLSDVRRLLRVRLALRAMVPLPPAAQLAYITRALLYPCGRVCRCCMWVRRLRMWPGEPVDIWHTTRL